MAKEKPKKPSLSATALRTIMRCPQQYYYRWVENIKVPPGIAQIIGIGVHKVANLNLSNKKDKGELLSEDSVKDAAADNINGLWQQGIKLDDEEKKEGPKKIKGQAVDLAVSLSTLHHQELAPKIEPVHLERFFRLELQGYPMDLTGRMDVEEKDSIRDLKTAGKSPSEADVLADDQLTLYALGKKVMEGNIPGKLYLDSLVKTKVPKLVTLETTREQKHLDRILRHVERAIVVIEKGAFMANSNGWHCSKRFCGYHDICPFFSGRN